MNSSDSSTSSEDFFPVEDLRSPYSVFCYKDPTMFSGLIKAVAEGNIEKVKEFVRKPEYSVNINDNHGNTALHVAVLNQSYEILEYLLEEETIVVNSRNFYGCTPLFFAVYHNRINFVKRLIQAGANVNIPNNEDMSPLHAVSKPEIAQLLIQNGANIDAINYHGETPLHRAVEESYFETTCLLLYYDAEPNIVSEKNVTPFVYALHNKDFPTQKLLLEYIVDFNIVTNLYFEPMYILQMCLVFDSPFIEDILRKGCDVNYHLLENMHETINAFQVCLEYKNPRNFKLIFDKFTLGSSNAKSIIQILCESDLNNEEFCTYLNVICESENILAVIESSSNHDICTLANKFKSFQLDTNFLTKVCMLFCSYGYQPTSTDLDFIFDTYGYNELFKMLLHLDISISLHRISASRIIYDPCLTVGLFLNNKNVMLKHFNLYEINHKIPLLQELARNVARDFIIQRFNIKHSRQYFTLINILNIPNVCKKYLTFELELYN